VGTRIGVSGRDSGGLGGGIEGFGRVLAVARLLGGTLGSNCCKAFRLALCFSFEIRQRAQVANSLLPRPAEASLQKEESGRFWKQEEQYLASITDVESDEGRVYRCKRVWKKRVKLELARTKSCDFTFEVHVMQIEPQGRVQGGRSVRKSYAFNQGASPPGPPDSCGGQANTKRSCFFIGASLQTPGSPLACYGPSYGQTYRR
jgi:hypothetical protein